VVRERYNGVRLHAGIGYVTPNDEHQGRGPAIRKARQAGLEQARLQRLAWHREHRQSEPPEEPGDVGWSIRDLYRELGNRSQANPISQLGQQRHARVPGDPLAVAGDVEPETQLGSLHPQGALLGRGMRPSASRILPAQGGLLRVQDKRVRTLVKSRG
jgi:hypothetical protein